MPTVANCGLVAVVIWHYSCLVFSCSGELECYMLDVGVTRIVQVSDVCCQCPPMMFSMAAQALSCKLIDVQMVCVCVCVCLRACMCVCVCI